jgi:hypothetical protein
MLGKLASICGEAEAFRGQRGLFQINNSFSSFVAFFVHWVPFPALTLAATFSRPLWQYSPGPPRALVCIGLFIVSHLVAACLISDHCARLIHMFSQQPQRRLSLFLLSGGTELP